MLTSGVFAGCLDDATDGPDASPGTGAPGAEPTNEETLVEDPAGDAQQYDANGVGEAADAHACSLGVPPCGALSGDTLPSEGGVPVHPAFDILSGGMAETPEMLILSIVVADLPEGLEGALEPGQGGFWDLSWKTEGGGYQNAFLAAAHRDDGRIDINAQVEDYCADTEDGNQDCYEGPNWWWWSSSTIAYDVEYGAPGAIRLHVPRDVVARPEQSDVLELFHVGTGLIDGGVREVGMIHYGAQGGELPSQSGTLWNGLRDGHVDETHSDPPARYAFQTPHERWSGRDTSARSEQPATAAENAYEDVLATVVSDTPQTLTIQVEVAQVEDRPVDHQIAMFFSFEGGEVYQGGVKAQDGTRTPWTSTTNESGEPVHIPVKLDVEAGTPGTYSFTYDRKDLKPLDLDERLSMLWVYPATNEVAVNRQVGDFRVQVAERSSDDVIMANPYWIQNAAAESVSDGETATADDAMFDTTSPTMLDDTQVANFDITQVTVTGIQPDLTRVTLDMRTLDEVLVPVGYDAVFYAVAMETDQGHVMVGYRQDTSDRQDWFCSPDVAVFAESPSDPLKVARTPIQGGLRQGVNDAAPGFVFFVPHSCLGEDTPGPLTIDRWAAGSFLVQSPGGATDAVSIVDDTSDENGPATFGTALPVTASLNPQTAWYAEPLGISNFWDITGLGVALLLALGGALLVWRRRRLLARYLREVDQAERVKNALARETVLAEIRGNLRTDLTKGRLPESHFMLVDKRIESLIGKARSALFAETFGDLPHRLVGRLEAILADGVITSDERDMASRLVSEARIPASDKKRVLAKLAGWDLEDVLVRA